jgi:hypothetical protein
VSEHIGLGDPDVAHEIQLMSTILTYLAGAC